MGLIRSRDKDDSAGVAIESVDDAGASRPADRAERFKVVRQRRRQRSSPVTFGRMDDHVGWFIDRHKVLVLEQNIQRDGFRDGGVGNFFRWAKPNRLVRLQTQRRFRFLAIDQNRTISDGALKFYSAEASKMRDQK